MGKRPGDDSRFWAMLPPPFGESDPATAVGIRRPLLKIVQLLAVAGRDFRDDRCLLQASSLSFTSILSLVPFLALAFAVLKGFGVQNRLEPFLLEQLTAGSEEAVSRIISYINNTNMTSLGAVGLLSLLITVISLFASIEEAFNGIWGVSETRSLYRKFSDYLSVALLAPLLMLCAISITTTMQSQAIVRWLLETAYVGDLVLFGFRVLPYLSIWLALTCFYLFIPNTKVSYRSAVIGGVLAGTLWQIAQWGYIHFQVGIARYNAIYGTLALLPLVMVWIYTSWLIILYGGEVVCTHQTLRGCRRGVHLAAHHALLQYLALCLFRRIGRAFVAGEPPRTVESLAAELDVPERTVRSILDFFATRGLLAGGGGDRAAFLPARDIAQIPVDDVLAHLLEYGGGSGSLPGEARDEAVDSIICRLDRERGEKLAGLTVRDLALLRDHGDCGEASDGS